MNTELGKWEFMCTSCGKEIDKDHEYCEECDLRGGMWGYVDHTGNIDWDGDINEKQQ
jgi:hypothetical protein